MSITHKRFLKTITFVYYTTYYNEIRKGKLTGAKYVLTYKDNQYEMIYTRQTDNKNFVFSGSEKPEHCTW